MSLTLPSLLVAWLTLAQLLAASGRPLDTAQPLTQAREDKDVFYIFGYGSLLNKESAQKTNCGLSGLAEGSVGGLERLLALAAGQAGQHGDDALARLYRTLESCAPKNVRAVRVSGLRRGWYASADSFGPYPIHPWPESAYLNGFSALGAYFDEGYTTTGIVYEATAQEYNATLRREGGYRLTELGPSHFTVLGGPELPPGARVTVFGMRPERLRHPTAKAPIASSYVDVFLSGAQELQAAFGLEGDAYRRSSPDQQYSSFMEETIRTTYAWSRYWVNDRSTPLRPFVESPAVFYVDIALWNWAPHEALQGMRFPGQPWEEPEKVSDA